MAARALHLFISGIILTHTPQWPIFYLSNFKTYVGVAASNPPFDFAFENKIHTLRCNTGNKDFSFNFSLSRVFERAAWCPKLYQRILIISVYDSIYRRMCPISQSVDILFKYLSRLKSNFTLSNKTSSHRNCIDISIMPRSVISYSSLHRENIRVLSAFSSRATKILEKTGSMRTIMTQKT